jgi:hypothetical protein
LNATTLSSTKWLDKAQFDALLIEEVKEDQVNLGSSSKSCRPSKDGPVSLRRLATDDKFFLPKRG